MVPIIQMIPIKAAKANGIQRGANTHFQDQSMTLHNFSVMKIASSNPGKPIPVDVVVFESLIFLNYL